MITIALLAALTAAPASAVETLPALPSLAYFQQSVKEAPALLTPVGAPVSPSAAPVLPATFSIYARFFSLTNTYDIVGPGKQGLGTMTEKFWSLTKQFTYVDGAKNKVAVATARFFALGSVVDVVDGSGAKIGTIKEELLKSFFKVYTSYKILDASGRQIATSEKTDWLSTEIIIRDGSGHVVAELRRDFFSNLLRLTDKWDVTIRDAQAVDARLIVIIAAYKSAVDADRRAADAADALSDALKDK